MRELHAALVGGLEVSILLNLLSAVWETKMALAYDFSYVDIWTSYGVFVHDVVSWLSLLEARGAFRTGSINMRGTIRPWS